MVTRPTYLAAGQRYARFRPFDACINDQIVILAVVPDRCGTTWVTFHAADGRDYSRQATDFERAIAAGDIVPLALGSVPRC
jgi:hypothetical protein